MVGLAVNLNLRGEVEKPIYILRENTDPVDGLPSESSVRQIKPASNAASRWAANSRSL
jgi:hypothetical protein